MNSWIIKEKLDLESILPVVDNLTDTLTELDLGKNTRSTQGPASQQWELIGCTENNWLDLIYGFIFTESVIKKSTGILRGKKVKCPLFF